MQPKAPYMSPLERYEQSLVAMDDQTLQAEIATQARNHMSLRDGGDHLHNFMAASKWAKDHGKNHLVVAATDEVAGEIRAKNRQKGGVA